MNTSTVQRLLSKGVTHPLIDRVEVSESPNTLSLTATAYDASGQEIGKTTFHPMEVWMAADRLDEIAEDFE